MRFANVVGVVEAECCLGLVVWYSSCYPDDVVVEGTGDVGKIAEDEGLFRDDSTSDNVFGVLS